MKTKKITREQAQEIAGNDYFVGNMDECCKESEKYNWKGTIPMSRLDNSVFLNTDTPSWSSLNEILVNENGDYWYKLLKVYPEWNEKKGKYFSGEEYTIWVDKKTGIECFKNPF